MTSRIKDLPECHATINNVKFSEDKTRLFKSVVEAQKDVISFTEQVSSDHYSNVKITRDIAAMQQNLNILLLKYENLQKQLDEMSKAKQALMQEQSLRLRHYNLYSQSLGFEIKPVICDPEKDLYQIKFSFKNISKVNPEKFYSFILTLQNNTYKVTDCVPFVPELNDMLEDLNKTDNLKRFVIQVRRRFCALSGSKEPLNDCTNDTSLLA